MITNRDFCCWFSRHFGKEIKPDTDLIEEIGMDFDTFIDFLERVMMKYNRIIPPQEFKDLYNGSRIVKYINNTEAPKDEKGKMKLLRMRLTYYKD